MANSDVGVTTSYHVGFATIMTGTGNISTDVKSPHGADLHHHLALLLMIQILILILILHMPVLLLSWKHATIDVVVGQGSSVIDFEKNSGYGYGNGDIRLFLSED